MEIMYCCASSCMDFDHGTHTWHFLLTVFHIQQNNNAITKISRQSLGKVFVPYLVTMGTWLRVVHCWSDFWLENLQVKLLISLFALFES